MPNRESNCREKSAERWDAGVDLLLFLGEGVEGYLRVLLADTRRFEGKEIEGVVFGCRVQF